MRREGNKLTAAAVRAASKPGLYGDGHGLYLQISAFDTKAWVFRYMLDGRARKMGLGPLHTISLAEARKRAAEARLKAHDGFDPIDDKRASRAQKRLEATKAITFRECADKYIEANRAGWKNAKHADQWASTFHETRRGSLIFPAATAAINDLPVSAIDTGLVLKVLEPIWSKTPESARRIRGRIESVLDWAKVRGYRDGENPSRWRGHLDKLLAKRPKASASRRHFLCRVACLHGRAAQQGGRVGACAGTYDLVRRPHRRSHRRPLVRNRRRFAPVDDPGTQAPAQTASVEPVTIGVSGPLRGQNAQYGAQWKKGFDFCLEEVSARGGVKGRPLQYLFEDSQADPRQTVTIAQKFVGDPKIVVEVGDFSGTASMAASPIYQRAGLVQFGFTNSYPNFTKGGDFIWSNSVSQADEQPRLAKYAADLGFKRVAVLYLNTDWGPPEPQDLLGSGQSRWLELVASEAYQPDEKDFRSTLVRVRDAKPDAIVLISYYADGALITRQIRTVGLSTPIVASGSIYSPKFIELAGDAANGVYTESNFFPGDNRPEIQAFVTKFRAKYNEEPDDFNTVAYDTIILLAAVINQYGVDRTAIRDGLAHIKDVPSVIYGKATFDPETRRVAGARAVYLMVKNGQYTLWDGKKPQRLDSAFGSAVNLCAVAASAAMMQIVLAHCGG